MTRYRLAIFDFDGTLADSLPWFRSSFQDLIARFDLAPVTADEHRLSGGDVTAGAGSQK